MRAAEEIIEAGEKYDVIVTPSGSGLTHAGLLAGFRNAGDGTRIVGSCVRRPAAQQIARIGEVSKRLEALLGGPTGVSASDIEIWDGALAPGYGRIGPVATEALKLAARLEGLFLDPVYSAKTLAAVSGMIAEEKIDKGAKVLFIHTGGLSALFAYEGMVRDALGAPAS